MTDFPIDVKRHRDWIVSKAVALYYQTAEIAQVLTNRRSNFSDQAVIADFERTEFEFHQIPFDEYVSNGIEQTAEMFKPTEALHPVHLADERYYPWHLPPSAEAPWNTSFFTFVPFDTKYDYSDPRWKQFKPLETKRWKVKEWLRYKHRFGYVENDNTSFHNLYNEIFVYNRYMIHRIKKGMSPFWTTINGVLKPVTYFWNTLHSRSHVVSADEPDKIRAVFGATKLLLMVENMFIWQLQRRYLNNDEGRMLWGREIMKGGWRKLFREIHNDGTPNTILTIDWSEFDKRLLFQLIDAVHKIWRSYFDFTKYAPNVFYPNGKTNPIEIERLWNWMCYSIKYTPILLPDGRLFQWSWNGFGSGYQQTQLMDTFGNSIMILTCLSSLGINIKSEQFWIRIQGDDSLVSFFERTYEIYGPSFLTQLAGAAKFYFNAKLNVKKSQILGRLSGATVLGYLNTYGIPYRTDEDLLRHLYFPERDQDYSRLAASALGLMLASTGCSQSFHNVCVHIWNELVLKRGIRPNFSSLSWMERANMIERIEALEGAELPPRMTLRAETFCEPTRTNAAKGRLWPTKDYPAGRFYFL
jgi:hypothetical protein